MYRLTIYEDDELKCLIHGNIDDLIFIIENINMKINYRFKITSI